MLQQANRNQGHHPMKARQNEFVRELDWNLLKTFSEIAGAGGISHAARRMSRRQPALSLALKRLEEQVGARLCVRGPRKFSLTDEGELVAELCTALVQLVGEIPDHVGGASNRPCRQIRFQTISNIVDQHLDAALDSFHRSYPEVEINIQVVTWEVVGRALLRQEIDVGIAPARFMHSELQYDFLFREVHRPYCGRPHRLYGRTLDDPAELADEAFILTGADEPDDLTSYRLRYGLGSHRAGLSEHLEEARRLTVLGAGICFLPEGFAAGDVSEGRLWPLLPPTDEPSMDIFVGLREIVWI